MEWNISVRYIPFGVMDKVAHGPSVSDCEPSEWLLACIEVKKWEDISGQRRGGGCGMDGVSQTREYHSIGFCITSSNDRGCDKPNLRRKTSILV